MIADTISGGGLAAETDARRAADAPGWVASPPPMPTGWGYGQMMRTGAPPPGVTVIVRARHGMRGTDGTRRGV